MLRGYGRGWSAPDETARQDSRQDCPTGLIVTDADTIYAAAHSGDLERVQDHAASGRLDEPLNPLGWTALMTAAAQGHAAVVRWLLDAGARPGVVGDDGDTALSLAAARGHADVVRLLTDEPRVDVNHRDGSGWTALMSAALRGHDEVVAPLLERDDLQVNAADVDGRTALIWAASAGHGSVARRLAGDPRVAVAHRAADGVTAAEVAREAGREELATELERQGSMDRPDVAASDLDAPPAAPPAPPGAKPIREPSRHRDDG